MVFTSFAFLFGFLPLLFLSYALTPGRLKNATLLLFSYVFYGWWRVDFCALLLISTLVDYVAGRSIEKASDQLVRRLWLVISVVFNLGLLGYFKYANFGIDSLNELLVQAGQRPLTWEAIVLPVGISFITFQTMSYTIDVYRGDVEAARNPVDFATYVALFPQLVAGPIVRYRMVADELKHRQVDWEKLTFGVTLFMIGFNKKVLLANNFGLMADEAFAQGTTGYLGAWVGILAYTLQIYFDFSGYSDMAVGLGAMLGFGFPRNFDGPYRSRSITEFWRRWHITLSTWIRDYLYISLGGNRTTRARIYRNLALSMLLCGLWHGANWTFIIWGAFHAAWLISERVLGREPFYRNLPAALQVALTLLIVSIGWVFFRADSLSHALEYLSRLVDFGGPTWAADAYWVQEPAMWIIMGLGWLIVFFGIDAIRLAERGQALVAFGQLGLFVWAIVELLSQDNNPFLYFQF